MNMARREFLPQGINMYVPAMAYSHDVVHRGIADIDFGALPATDDDGVHADIDGDLAAPPHTIYVSDFVPGTAGMGSLTTARFGQNVLLSPSADAGATGFVADIYGEDYLGQPMVERLTVANGQTTDTEGVKAFKRVLKIVTITIATNAITVDVGWGPKFGVPYRLGQVIGAQEGDLWTQPSGLVIGDNQSFTAADAAVSTHLSPIDGYFVGMVGRVTTAMTGAASTVTAALAGADFNAGDWVSPVAAAGFALGFTLDKADWGAVTRGQAIVWTSGGEGTAGVDEIAAIWSYGQGDIVMPSLIDPQTKITSDPRGLYDPQLAPNGVRNYRLKFMANGDVNTSNNGGLHGIKHLAA